MKTKKNISIITAIILAVLVLNSCDRSYSGDADIQGYLITACDSKIPLANVTVNFSIAGSDLITTKTDGNGYFRIKGSYSHKSRKGHSEPAISFNGLGAAFGYKVLAEGMPDKYNLDTIYYRNGTHFKFKVSDPLGLSTDRDTIYLSDWPFCCPDFPYFFRGDYVYTKKIAGPFADGAEFGSYQMGVMFPHVGFVRSKHMASNFAYFRIALFKDNDSIPSFILDDRLDFVKGQKNTPCSQLHTFEVTID